MDNNRYLTETALLDFNHPSITRLVGARNWEMLDQYEKIGATYNFVKDEVAFGYSEADDIPASKVLEDCYGQCNTKSILLMALLRKIGVPCRIHGFAIDKRVQKGAVPEFLYALSPGTLIHTWVEVSHRGQWLHLEGCILDPNYLAGVQALYGNQSRGICGYGAATEDIQNPPVRWQGTNTYVQKEAIVEDHGVFDSPDDLYRKRGSNLDATGIRRFLFKHFVRKMMNSRVARIRNNKPASDLKA